MISLNSYKSELLNIKNISSKILSHESFQMEDIQHISKIAKDIIESEYNQQKISELKNRYNPKIKLWKILDYLDKIEVEDKQLGSTAFWRRSIQIRKFYFCQEYYSTDDNNYDKYLYFGEIGENNLNKFSFYYIENGCGKISDNTIKNKIVSFIDELCNYFKIDNTIDPVEFLFFVLIMVHHNDTNDNDQHINNIDLDYDGYLFDQMFKYEYDTISNYLNNSQLTIQKATNTNLTQIVKFKKHMSEPWFSLVCCGFKNTEARLNIGDWINIEVGDYIKFTNDNFDQIREIIVKINNINIYNSFYDYLKNENIGKCLPTIKNINDGVKVYEQYYRIDDTTKSKLVKSFNFDLISNII